MSPELASALAAEFAALAVQTTVPPHPLPQDVSNSGVVSAPQSIDDVESEIAAIYAARRSLGTIGDWFPDEGEE